MQLEFQAVTVHKRVPLTISRGTSASSTNFWIQIHHEGITGWGEAVPMSIGESPSLFSHDHVLPLDHQRQTTILLQQGLEAARPLMEGRDPWHHYSLWQEWHRQGIPSAVRAGLDIALWDWRGKALGIPLWKIWGLEPSRAVPISVTIGISEPQAAVERLHRWFEVIPPSELGAVKIKLGSPAGIAADQAMFAAVHAAITETIATPVKISVDANGGWSVRESLQMAEWLAPLGVDSIEQPLPRGQEANLQELYLTSALPIFVDESCCVSQDIPYLADRVHGINIKLMKCSGLTGAWHLIHTARAHGLKVMFGCYSDSTLTNTAAAHLGSLADHLDLDSHLNLVDDPFQGAVLQQGRVLPNDQPGLGVCRAS